MKTIIIEAVLIICLLVILYAVLQMIRNVEALAMLGHSKLFRRNKSTVNE